MQVYTCKQTEVEQNSKVSREEEGCRGGVVSVRECFSVLPNQVLANIFLECNKNENLIRECHISLLANKN